MYGCFINVVQGPRFLWALSARRTEHQRVALAFLLMFKAVEFNEDVQLHFQIARIPYLVFSRHPVYMLDHRGPTTDGNSAPINGEIWSMCQ